MSQSRLLSLLSPLPIGLFALAAWGVVPRSWQFVAFLSAVAIGILMTVVAWRSRRPEHAAELRTDGRCDCGFDLRGAPARESSRHTFDVRGRMSSTKKTVVCPECGKRRILWEHE